MMFAPFTHPCFASLALTGLLCLATANAADVEVSPPIAKTKTESGQDNTAKALLICGGCCHDYQNQKEIISQGLSQTIGSIDWTIIQYAGERDVHADLYQSKDWIEGFDLVVHNECFGGVTDPDFVQGIVAAHLENKIPAMVIHCSMHSYRNSTAADKWREFVGVTSVRHEKSKQSMLVEPTDSGNSHPVLASLGGENWETVNGELYLINQIWPGTTVLATAFSNETNQAEPVIWVNEVDGTRIFGTTIGHHNETMLDPKYQSILADGWKWAMKQE